MALYDTRFGLPQIMADYLTQEQLETMLNETYDNQQTQDFIRPNPLQFQYPFIPSGIMNTGSDMYDEFPQGFSFRPQGLDTSRFTGVDLESGYLDRAGSSDQDIYAEQEKQKGGGIGGLLKFLVGLAVPGAGFLMNLPGRGLEGIKSLNQRIQGSDFGQSTSLTDYLDMRKYGGAQGRRDASARTMAQARGLQKQIDQRPSAIGGGGGGGGRDMGASASRSAAATRSKDLGSMRGGVGR